MFLFGREGRKKEIECSCLREKEGRDRVFLFGRNGRKEEIEFLARERRKEGRYRVFLFEREGRREKCSCSYPCRLIV